MILWVALACTKGEPADLVVQNGTIAVDLDTTSTALAVRGGVIVAVGDEALDLAGPDTTIVDAGGGFVMAGFEDTHTHLLPGSFAMDRLLLLGTASMPGIASALRAYLAEVPADEPWIVGYGWLTETAGAEPDRALIDEIVSDRPVLLVSNSGHEAIVNAKALELAGITADTPDPADGRIGRYEDGTPNGYLVEGAVKLLSDLVLAAYDDERLAAALPRRFEEFGRSGITGVHEILAAPGFAVGRPWIYRDLEDAGALPMRVTWYYPVFRPEDVAAAVASRDEAPDGDLVRFGGVKLWIDGSMGSAEAWVEQPYASGGTGSPYFTPESLLATVRAANDAGIQLKVHANGDAAIDAVLDTLEVVAAEDGLAVTPVLEHCVLPDDADLARLVAMGIPVSVQPTHWIGARFGETADELGDERWGHAYDYAAFRDAGVPMSTSTDWPVWPSQQPLLVSWNAQARDDGHGMTLDEALRGYTEVAGHVLGRGDELGRLDVGYLADFLVMSADPRAVPVAEVPDVAVREVYVAGIRRF